MAKAWMRVALMAGWLGACATGIAQTLPVAETQPAPAAPDGPLPGGVPAFCAPCPEPLCPPAPVARPEEPCAPGPCLQVDFEYLLWYTRKQSLPPLLTSGAFSDPIPGALGQPNTRVLISGNDAAAGMQSGGRLTLGTQLDQDLGLNGSGFFLQQGTGRKVVGSAGAPGSSVLARPFFNANANNEDADPVAVPNVMSGTFTVEMPQRLYGTDLNLRYTYLNDRSQNSRLLLLAGARFLRLEEALAIGEALQDLPGLGAAGNSYSLSENFHTRNDFYGGQVGFDYEWFLGPVYFDLIGKFAFGSTSQSQTNTANTRVTEPDGTVTVGTNRALLIQPSNAGTRNRDVFSFVPEATARLGLDLNEHIRIGVGYNFLYWTGVARPGSQIDRAINIQALQPFDQVGVARPAPVFASKDFWAQGLTVNLGFTF